MHPKSASRHQEGVASVAFVARWTPTRPTRGVAESVIGERKPAPTRGRGGLVVLVVVLASPIAGSISTIESPVAQDVGEVGAADGAVAIDVNAGVRSTIGSPGGEENAQV